MVNPNDWCKGIDLGNGQFSGCACDCPACKRAVKEAEAYRKQVQQVAAAAWLEQQKMRDLLRTCSGQMKWLHPEAPETIGAVNETLTQIEAILNEHKQLPVQI
jgi:hypothetical protein